MTLALWETERGQGGPTAGGVQICSGTTQSETRSLIEDQNPGCRPGVYVSIFHGVWRILSAGQKQMFDKLKFVAGNLKREIKVYQMVMKDGRTPKLSKILLGLAVGYLLLPFDIIPDFIPVIGHVDDAIIVPVLILLALRNVPQAVLDDCRMRASSQ